MEGRERSDGGIEGDSGGGERSEGRRYGNSGWEREMWEGDNGGDREKG